MAAHGAATRLTEQSGLVLLNLDLLNLDLLNDDVYQFVGKHDDLYDLLAGEEGLSFRVGEGQVFS